MIPSSSMRSLPAPLLVVLLAGTLLLLPLALALGWAQAEDGVDAADAPETEEAAPPAGTPEDPLVGDVGDVHRISGHLTTDDARDDRGGRFDAVSVQIPNEQGLRLAVTSESFDPIVRVRYPSGRVEMNDDGRYRGFGAAYDAVMPGGGVLTVEVAGFLAGARGSYNLAIRRIPVDARQYSGNLLLGDPRREGREFYDAYPVTLANLQQVEVEMTSVSERLDPFIEIVDADGQILAAADDIVPGEDRNARIRFTAPIAGDYVIRASTFGPQEDPGEYRLAKTILPAPDVDVWEGQLISADADNASERAAQPDVYIGQAEISFRAATGQRIRIEVMSGDFDPRVQLYRMPNPSSESDDEMAEGGEMAAEPQPEWLAEDDDGGDALNARLVHVVRNGGIHMIRVRPAFQERPASGDGAGRFRVQVWYGEPTAVIEDDPATAEVD